METYLAHYGILGMKWGVRRYQNEDGTLTAAGRRHYQRLDNRWVKRKSEGVYKKARKESNREIKKYASKLAKKYDPNSRTFMNEYNRKLADLMTEKVSNLSSPSGKAIRFIAKRGELGVHMALADQGYDMYQVRNGVWSDGRIGYKKQKVQMAGR